jgi:hypothetical protein
MIEMKVGNVIVELAEEPDLCPVCLHSVEPRPLGSNVSRDHEIGGAILELLCRCPRSACGRAFIALYLEDGIGHSGNRYFKPTSLYPRTIRPPDVPVEAAEISPRFATLFGQAHSAEHYGLEDIAGAGYRKALEFLLKDFCIREHPSAEAKIQHRNLGAVITEYVTDANIKTCAHRAAWLGNDETHYLRLWNGRDISDLKRLISLTVGWIVSSEQTRKLLEEMPGRPKG